jgi:hypothetical protein
MTGAAMHNDYDEDSDPFLSSEEHDHDDVHPCVVRRLAFPGATTVLDVGDGNWKLARLLPALNMCCLLIDLSANMRPDPLAPCVSTGSVRRRQRQR